MTHFFSRVVSVPVCSLMEGGVGNDLVVRPDYEGAFASREIPAAVIGRISQDSKMPTLSVKWYWNSNGLQFLQATHKAWISYNDHGRSDLSQTAQYSSASLDANFDFGALVQGGIFTAQCSVHFRDPATGQEGDTGLGEQKFSIRGDNPPVANIKSLLGDLPLQVIAYMESRFRHFDNSGLPLFGPPRGFGVMQLDTPPPTSRQLWDWHENVSGGKFLYVQKKTQVEQHFNNLYTTYPDARKLNDEEIHTSLYQFYNGGFYWSWDSNGKIWKKSGPTAYGDEGHRIETLVKAGTPPPDWG